MKKFFLMMMLLAGLNVLAFAADPNVSDSEDALAVWHMELNEGIVEDDDPCNPSRDNYLICSSGITSVPGVNGNAIHFDGGDTTIGLAYRGWEGQSCVKVECDFKADTTTIPSGFLVTARNTWMLSVVGTSVQWIVVDSNPAGSVAHTIQIDNIVDPNEWQHVVATLNYKQMELTVDDQTVSLDIPFTIISQWKSLNVGNKDGTPHPFLGSIDEVKISVPDNLIPEGTEPAADWEMDEILTGPKVPDNDIDNPGRDNDLNLFGGPVLTTSGYDANALVLDANNIDGLGDYGMSTNLLYVKDKVAVTCYVKFDKPVASIPANGEYVIHCSNMFDLVRIPGGKIWWATAGNKLKGTVLSENIWYKIEASLRRIGTTTDAFAVLRTTDMSTNTVIEVTGTLPIDFSLPQYVQVGEILNFGYYFDGTIDKVKIYSDVVDLEPEGLETAAFWEMDSFIVGPKVADNDADDPGRDNDLNVYGGAMLAPGYIGNALVVDANYIDGIGDYGQSTNLLYLKDGVKLTCYVKFDTPAASMPHEEYIVTAGQMVAFERAVGGKLWWATYGDKLKGGVVNENIWYYIEATMKRMGDTDWAIAVLKYTNMSDSSVVEVVRYLPIDWSTPQYVEVGDISSLGLRYFDGMIDNVTISSDPITCGDFGYYPGDINADCYVDIEDLRLMAESWLLSGDGDLDSSGTVNLIDFEILADDWTKSTLP